MAATLELRTHPAYLGDLLLLCALFHEDFGLGQAGFAYPRCEDLDALLAELDLYGLSLDQAMTMVDAPAEAIGAYGLLYEPEEVRARAAEPAGAAAFLVGPLVARREQGARAMDAMVARAECDAGRLGLARLRSVPGLDNRLAAGVLAARGWVAGKKKLEMRWDAGGPPLSAARHEVRRLRADDPLLVPAADLLAACFDWTEDGEARLRASLDQGYSAGVVDEGGVAGVAIHIAVPGTEFGRLEYVAVDEAKRGRGVGAALVARALAELQAAGRSVVFLSLDADDVAARALYRRLGFADSIVSVEYSWAVGLGQASRQKASEPTDDSVPVPG